MLSLKYVPVGRNSLSALTRPRIIILALAFALVSVVGARTWQSHATQIRQTDHQTSPLNQKFSAQVRAGIGSEVRFANPGDSSERIRGSVESADNFIYSRSGLKMSNPTKARLIEMETRTLNGTNRRVSIEYLTSALAETAMERLSRITDQEISYAATVLLADKDVIQPRASGGRSTTAEEFINQTRLARDASIRNDSLVKKTINIAIDGEVRDRITFLSEALPAQFGRAQEDGITPLQALLISYSVVADDTMSRSRADLQSMIDRSQVKERNPIQDQTRRKAFGAGGQIFSTPLDLVFETGTVRSFLDRIEKGGAK